MKLLVQNVSFVLLDNSLKYEVIDAKCKCHHHMRKKIVCKFVKV